MAQSKNNRKKKKKKTPRKIIPKEIIADTPTKKNKATNWLNIVLKIIFALAAIAGIIAVIPTLRGCLLTPKQKWDEENTEQGVIKSPKISENYIPIKVTPNFNYDTTLKFPKVKGIYIKGLKQMQSLAIAIGEHIFLCPVHNLYEGIEILNPIYRDCSNTTLALAAKDDRLYVSTKFVALRDSTEIGFMDFNHWTIYNGNYLDYTPGDDRFEVKDKQGNIVFSIFYSKRPSFVEISGYFVGPTSVIVLTSKEAFKLHVNGVGPTDCIQKSDSNWKVKAEIEIAKIKSAFEK